jgi:hypothetical protein
MTGKLIDSIEKQIQSAHQNYIFFNCEIFEIPGFGICYKFDIRIEI